MFENATNADVSGLDISVNVQAINGDARFFITNNSSTPSVVTLVTFDDCFSEHLNFSDVVIQSSAGVSFAADASPQNLPGGNDIDFNTAFSVSREQAGGVSNGVDPGESLTVFVDLLDNVTLEDLADCPIGIHIQSLANNASVSAATGEPGPTIPEPASATLLGLGAAALLARRRATR